jgi:hypothetical protein
VVCCRRLDAKPATGWCHVHPGLEAPLYYASCGEGLEIAASVRGDRVALKPPRLELLEETYSGRRLINAAKFLALRSVGSLPPLFFLAAPTAPGTNLRDFCVLGLHASVRVALVAAHHALSG